MAFKLKDLIIGLLPHEGEQACPRPPAGFCGPLSAQVMLCKTASPPVVILPECARTAGFGPDCVRSPGDGLAEAAPAQSAAQDLAALKQQLQQALAQVEEQERALTESYRPQTLAEAEELEARLREALAELQQHKEDLKKG